MSILAKAHTGAPVGIFTENSVRQAQGLLSGVLPGGMGAPPIRGTADYLRAYAQMPWLRAVAMRISQSVAQADWQLYVVKGKGEAKARAGGIVTRIQRAQRKTRVALLKQAANLDELQQIDAHPLLDVLSDANEFQTGMAVRKVTQIHLDLVGDAFWLKERDAQGMIVGLWPIPPHWIVATPTPSFRFFRVSFRAWRGIIPDTEFTWFSDVDPLNPYGRGTGTAMALGDELETDEYAARMTKAFFYNSGRPDLLVWPKGPGNVRESEVKRLEEDWIGASQGFFRSFKPYFLTREVQVKELEQNFRAIQLVQLREYERNMVLQVFGIPPEILGVLEHSNRATIDAAEYHMSRYVVEPRLELLRSVMQERLVPEFDERLIIEYVSPVQDDRTTQLAAATVAPWALSMDDWRKLSGQQPMEDAEAGALHMVPSVSKPTSVADMVNPPEPPPMPALPGGPPKPGLPAAEQPPKRVALGYAVQADYASAVDAGDEDLAAFFKRVTSLDIASLPAPSAVAARQEPGLAKALAKAWTAHARGISVGAIAEALGPSGVHGDILPILDLPGLAKAQTDALRPALVRAVLSGAEVGGNALRRHGVSVRGIGGSVSKPGAMTVDMAAVNQLATEWAQQHAGSLVQSPAEIREIIRQLVVRANEEGIPPDRLARLIRSTIGLTDQQARAVLNFQARLEDRDLPTATVESRVARYSLAQLASRALTIARTELIGALNHGQQALWGAAVKQGVIKDDQFVQVWLVTEDDALDAEICEPLADTTVALGEPWQSDIGPIDAPPAHPNCRCAIGLEPVSQLEAARHAPVAKLPEIAVHIHQPAPPEAPRPAVQRRFEIARDGYGNMTGIDVKYSDDQPRDDHGRWSNGGGSASENQGSAGGTTGHAERQAIIDRPSSAYPQASPGAVDSDRLYRDASGKLTPERQALHDAIIAQHFADKTPAEGQPSVVILGGGPASGKSSLPGIVKGGAIAIDVDGIRAQLPEFRELRGQTHASSYTHEESSKIGKQVAARAAREGYSVVLDGTGDSNIENLAGKVNQFRSQGFTTEAQYVTVDTETAVARANARAQRAGPNQGRYVPETVIRHVHAAVSGTFPKAVAAGLFDHATLWDNNGATPVQIMSSRGTKVTIHDQGKFDRFLAKAKP